jgi:competence protein ComEC
MFIFFLSSLLGIVISFFHVTHASALAFFCITLFLYVWSRHVTDSGMKKIYSVCIIVCCGLFVGQVRMMFFSIPHTSVLQMADTHDVPEKISVQGMVSREPVSDGETQNIYLHTTHATIQGIVYPLDTTVLIRTHAFPLYAYGDELMATGTLKVPSTISAEDGRVFNYQMYLLKDGVTHTLSFGSVQKSGETGNSVFRLLFSLKRHIVHSLSRVLPQPESNLLGGILLGIDSMSQTIQDEFRVAGLSHIIVLSGYNITVVAESILAVATAVGISFAFPLACIGVLLFVCMTGFGASAIRAGIMASIALIGRHFGKTYRVERALAVAVWGMVMWNPLTLVYDPSFHLSVLATIGIMYMTPVSIRWFLWVPEKYGLRDICATTWGVQLFVLPYIIYMSGMVSLFAFPANLFVLPFVPLTMFLGFLTGVIGLFSHILAYIPGLPTYLFLWFDLHIAHFVSRIPHATIHIPFIPAWLLVVTYIFFGIFLYHFHTKDKEGDNENIIRY